MNGLTTYFIVSMIHIPIVHIFLGLITGHWLPKNVIDYITLVLLAFMFPIFWILVVVYSMEKKSKY